MDNNTKRIEIVLAKAFKQGEIIPNSELKEGEIYATRLLNNIASFENITNQPRVFDFYEPQMSEKLQAGDYLTYLTNSYLSIFSENEEIKTLMLVQYLGNGIFKDIQSGAIIAPAQKLNLSINNYYIFKAEEKDKLDNLLKQYQLFYDENNFPLYSLEGTLGTLFQELYYETILSNKELSQKRKQAVYHLKQFGINAKEFQESVDYFQYKDRIQPIAEVENFIYDQTHKIK